MIRSYQAVSSTDGQVYTWQSDEIDYLGAGYPGPGTPLHILQISPEYFHGDAGGDPVPQSSGTYALVGGAGMSLVHSYDVPAMTTGQGLVLGFRVTAKNDDNAAVGFGETTIPALQTSGGVLILGDVDWSAMLPYGWDVSVSPLVGSAGVGVSVMPGAVNGTVLVEIWHGDPITWELST
jgi:hypothetical protein